MAIRIKNRWHRSKRNDAACKDFGANAGALAFIIWRLAVEHAIDLHREGYDYDSDRERIRVIGEYCAFGLQLIDRLAHHRVDDEARTELLTSLGRRLADRMHDNLVDIAGPGDYRAPFVAMINERIDKYARFGFEGGEPDFPMLRFFGNEVMSAMGISQTNRWVMDQVMDISAPEFCRKITASVENLLATAD
ncbi:hypothetical protein [Thioalkalivibrio sp. HK1]|uniref:hypothetical protein n=1 Tax=Thioalkalivibrio sp. HK1 TaxID=1469245 RepID=UPI000470C55D|nr:hypothetical protein [Thioalkalivibrio sp. HK1]